MVRKHLFPTLTFLLALSVISAEAGPGTRTGTAGASELLIPVGARDIAMGGAVVATTSGIDGLFWNPASMAKMQSSASVYVSHLSYLAGIGVDYGAVGARFEGLGCLALSLKSLSIGQIPVTTTTNPDGTGQNFTPQYFTVGLSYSRKLSDRIAVGFTTNLITERLGEVSATGVAFTVGVCYDNLALINGLSLAVAIRNVGPQMRFDGSGLLALGSVNGQNRPPQYYAIQSAPFELPSSFEFGLGYKTPLGEDNAILLTGDYQSNNFSNDEYKLGVEYTYQDLFAVRGGYALSQNATPNSEYLFGPSFGAGIHSALGSIDITVDYAFRATKLFENQHTIAVKLGF